MLESFRNCNDPAVSARVTELDAENVPQYDGDRLLIVLGADWRSVAAAFQLEPAEVPELEG